MDAPAFHVTKRLFIGLELPASIQHTLAAIDPHLRGLRWVRSEQMHLTTSFLGDVPASAEPALHDTLAQVNVPPFFLPVAGVGTFGGAQPTVVWAGVGKAHPHLFALHHHVQDAVLRAGLEADLKPFRPHITIGRARGVSPAMLKPFLREYGEREFGLWKVSGFVLFSSARSLSGSVYTAEFRRNLDD